MCCLRNATCCKVLIYNTQSICATLVLKYLNFQGIQSTHLLSLYINVTSHMSLWDSYISMNSICSVPGIRSQVLCCSEKLFEVPSRAPQALFNQEIISSPTVNKCCLHLGICLALLLHVVMMVFRLGVSWPIQLHL